MTCWMFTRFREGLKTLGLLDVMKFSGMFTPSLSPIGRNKRHVENQILAWWFDFLADVEGMCISVAKRQSSFSRLLYVSHTQPHR